MCQFLCQFFFPSGTRECPRVRVRAKSLKDLRATLLVSRGRKRIANAMLSQLSYRSGQVSTKEASASGSSSSLNSMPSCSAHCSALASSNAQTHQ